MRRALLTLFSPLKIRLFFLSSINCVIFLWCLQTLTECNISHLGEAPVEPITINFVFKIEGTRAIDIIPIMVCVMHMCCVRVLIWCAVLHNHS